MSSNFIPPLPGEKGLARVYNNAHGLGPREKKEQNTHQFHFIALEHLNLTVIHSANTLSIRPCICAAGTRGSLLHARDLVFKYRG